MSEGKLIMATSKVAVLKTTPATAVEDYKKLLAMADVKNHLNPKKTTILKDNISWHFFYPAANTTPWQLEGTIQGLRENGFNDLVCVQNRTVVINAFKGERNNKYPPIFKKNNIPVKYNFLEKDMKWIKYQPKGKLLVLDKIFPEGIRIPDFFFDKNVLHLPTVKCHVYTTMTGAMKNAFGGLLNSKRHYTHSAIHKTLVDLLMIQKEIHSGIFATMDGTVAGNGPGPRTMKFETKNIILASADSVAIDAVSSHLMGFDPMKVGCIRTAHEQGLGCGNFSEIEIVGEDIKNTNWKFSVGDNAATAFVKPFWFGPLAPIQKLFFHTPLVYFFVLGSMLFHDYVWYPTKGKKVINEYLKTEWGKFWQSYPYE